MRFKSTPPDGGRRPLGGLPARIGAVAPSDDARPPPAGDRAMLPAAAALPVVPLLTGPLRPADVWGVFDKALLLGVETPTGPRMIAVLAKEASEVPNGVRIAVRAADRPFAADRPGDAAFVGAGGITLTGRQLRLVRRWRTAVAPIDPAPSAVAALTAMVAMTARGAPGAAAGDLRDALASPDGSAIRDAVQALVGLGAGLTPGGDDLLAGLLAASHALGRRVMVEQITAALAPRLSERTTALSADLLRLAAAGHACTEVLSVLTALDRRSAGRDLDRSLRRLLAVGHTSGADLATGLALGMSATIRPPNGRARPARLMRAADRSSSPLTEEPIA